MLSIVTLLKLDFQLLFWNNGVFLYLGTIYYGCDFSFDDFLILYMDYSNFDNSFALLTSSNNVDSIKCHFRLRHTGQDRMARVVKECLIGNLSKVSMLTCEH